MIFEMYKVHQVGKMAILVLNFFLLIFLLQLECGQICFKSDFPVEFLQVNLPIRSPTHEMEGEDFFHHSGVNTTLININNFKYLLNNENLCPSFDPEWNVLLIVAHSARKNFKHRNAIRSTWGSVRKYKNWKIRLVFLLGMESPGNKKQLNEEILIQYESQKNGDIVEGNFVDSYRNMTYKHIMGYQWALTFCEHADFIFKIDDDVFANTFGVVDVLNEYSGDYSLFCQILIGKAPIRDQTYKWYVAYDEYTSLLYPPYCLGAGYFISMKWIRRIHSAAAKVKFFWIDDVFVTGVLREYAQAQANEKMALLDLRNIWVETTEWDFVALHSIHPFYSSGKKFFALYCYMDSHSDKFAHDMKMLWDKSLRMYYVTSYELED